MNECIENTITIYPKGKATIISSALIDESINLPIEEIEELTKKEIQTQICNNLIEHNRIKIIKEYDPMTNKKYYRGELTIEY